MTGILLLALGHKHYAEMACNLAMSLRVGAPNVDITLAWHGYNPQELSPAKQKLFNKFIELTDDDVTKNGAKRYFRAKTLLNKITPYITTLYLDADMLWFKQPVTQLFEQLKNVELTTQNWGIQTLQKGTHQNLDMWSDTETMAEAYGLWDKQYAPIHSELVWFKKTDKTDELFTLANQIFDNPKVPTFCFAGDVADEFAFNIAMAILGMYPHKIPWMPVWWFFRPQDKTVPHEEIFKRGYIAMSMGGNDMPNRIITRYNAILRYAAQKAGVVNYWKYVPKRRWAAERANA